MKKKVVQIIGDHQDKHKFTKVIINLHHVQFAGPIRALSTVQAHH